MVTALLPEKYEFVKENQWIYLENMEAEVVDEHIKLTFEKGYNEIIKKVPPPKNSSINFVKDISKAKWV